MSAFFRLISWITVEPVELFYCLMFTTSKVVKTNLFIEKVCRLDFNYTEEICNNFTSKGLVDKEIELNVQDRVAELKIYEGLIAALPAAFFCLFVGPWSDVHGRKILLILPLLGNIVAYAACIVNYYFFFELDTNFLLLSSVYGFFGAYQCFNMGLYGYVSDITSAKNRTIRLSLVNGIFSLGFVVGTKLGSYLFQNVSNYYIIFGTSIGFALCGIFYTLFCVKESVKKSKEEKNEHKFFDLANVKGSFQTTFKKRPNNDRTRLILLVLNFMTFMFCMNTSRFDYLLVGLKYDWTIVEFSNYLSIQRICRLSGLFLLLPLLSRVLKVPDGLVSSIGTLGTTIAYLLIALGDRDWPGPIGWVMYLSAGLQFNSIVTVIIRSECSKTVGENEIGKIFSVVALGQAIVPLISNPLYGFLYRATLTTFPGAYLILLSVLLLLSFLSSVYLYWDSRRRSKEKREMDSVEITHL